ncbi:MAG: hypothetical protein RMM06_03675 [Armatimonadota bacterium]|nr:hypothetical protein [bacterium]MDW8289795.1 hypothetical protein [Armatimonadota bacterium]
MGTSRPAVQDEWKRYFSADDTPQPLRDPADPTLWPNRWSRANSDEWIARNHDRLRQMRPRVLLINFSNQVAPEKPLQLAQQLIAAMREASRYHGYRDPKAPPFLEYTLWRFVDLRDPDRKEKNSRKVPVKPHVPDPQINCDYNAFFSEQFAEYIGVRDPRNRRRFLRLDELVDRGYVHEVWFTAAATGDFRCLECVELKPMYDEQFRKIPGKHVQAGNGGDPDQQWTGRSVRLNCINHDRGIGCAMENLGHSMEGLAHSRAIPYFTRYFYEYAGFDLDKRYGLPFNSFYPLWGEGKGISYPDPHTAVVTDGRQTWRIENYVAAGGNVHFPPNARRHYDLNNTEPVMSTIEDWRIGSGSGGKDLARPWTSEVLKRYADLAPDCMGKWLVYWWQNMPGLNNRSRDDEGKPMKNWWVFWFY